MIAQSSLFDAPQVRRTDPPTAHLAAASVKPASRELCEAIRWFVARRTEPVTAFQIADAIYGQRWSHATVRTAVARAALTVADEEGRSPRGQRARRYVIGSA